LLNGTQFSAGYGVWCLLKAKHLLRWADTIAALSLDGFDCRLEPFDAKLHAIRPHQGQQRTAKSIRYLLKNSAIAAQTKTAIQDPYAFRCVPQVHGASADAIQYVEKVIETEINSVTDNPTIFPDEQEILSGGNFHAQPLALALDFLAIALAELGSISERRVFQLMLGKRGLPVFLTEQAGLHSGLMIAQYTAASITSQNKQLCSPASVDNVVSSNGQEDHVSMAANAATKCFRVVENVERLLAIELFCAAQAVELRRPLRTSPILEKILAKYRTKVPLLRGDRILHFDLEASVSFVRSSLFIQNLNN
jgi:histidine ammonia-lyase